MSCCPDIASLSLLDLFDARRRMITAARPVDSSEKVALSHAVDRVLANDVLAGMDMPGVDNSAMDGYALRVNDVCQAGLPVNLRIPAGTGVASLPSKSCARIFTGAPIPLGADAVVPQERVQLGADGRVHVNGQCAQGDNIRRRGEEARTGEPLLPAGTHLKAAAIALLASHGIDRVSVLRRLKVALVSTGDELIEPGTPRKPGQVYDSNRAMLKVLLKQASCNVLDLGVTADDPHQLQQTFLRARDAADLVICTGGISVGEEDHVRPLLEVLGGVSFHGVAIKPGKPVTLGYLGDSLEVGTPLIGLPGNPVASLVVWQLLALPLVHGCQGRIAAELQQFSVTAGFSRQGPRGRREVLRVVLDWHSGLPVAHLAGGQGSHMLSAASQSHGYLMIPVNQNVEEGQVYSYCPAAQFLD
ncbi:gephyrin-like molybdotransferase Glp [Vreelandella aquamarina]